MLKAITLAAPAAWLAPRLGLRAAEPVVPAVLPSWLNQTGGLRPRFVWENHEDLLSADLDLGTRQDLRTAPELAAFFAPNWVFNRALEWHREGLEGCLLCAAGGGPLRLTGADAVSAWHSDPANVLESAGETTRFVKRSTQRCRDAAVLPAFQFHLGQHPTLELEVAAAAADWQFCVGVKGRAGPPFLTTGWRQGPGRCAFDLAKELRRLGHELHFAQLHFVLGVWTEQPATSASVTFRLHLPSQPALVPALPVIRSLASARQDGVPVAAAVVDRDGQRLGADVVQVVARLGTLEVRLRERQGFWLGSIPGLKPGDYRAILASDGVVKARTDLWLRVTDGEFYSYDSAHRSLARRQKPTGPLSGCGQGTISFRDVGTAHERLVKGRREGDRWAPWADRRHGWEALTEPELDEWLSGLQTAGTDVLHFPAHEGFPEPLDAGGCLAPHAAEQLALYLRVADRRGLRHLASLVSPAYASPKPGLAGTPLPSRYLEAGFEDEDWATPAGPFEDLFHQYLRDFVTLFKDETALLGLRAAGADDPENGLPRSQDVFQFVRGLDRHHLLVAEPMRGHHPLLRQQTAGWTQDLLGGRPADRNSGLRSDLELAILAIARQQRPNLFQADDGGGRPESGRPEEPADPVADTAPDPRRTRWRDALYLGLLHRTPLLNTGDPATAELELRVFRRVRALVDWGQAFLLPKLAVRLDNSNLRGDGLRTLARYEEALARLPLAYQYVLEDDPVPSSALAVIDARQPFVEPRFVAAGGKLPDELKMFMPLLLSEGYQAHHLWSHDQRTLLAYVSNCPRQFESNSVASGPVQRRPRPTRLALTLQNLPVKRLDLQVFDLHTQKRCWNGGVQEHRTLELGLTARDYLVLVSV